MKLRIADTLTIITEKAQRTFASDDCRADDVRARQTPGKDGLRITLCADETPVKYLRLRWRFTPEEKRAGPLRVFGDEWERGYGAMEWRGIVAERNMPWVCAVSNGSDAVAETAGRFTECFGVAVRPAGLCMWRYDACGVTLAIDVRNGGSGVILGGREVEVCEARFGEYRNVTAFAALRDFYKTLCADPIFPKKPVYGSNNWYYAYGNSSHEQILSDASFLAARCAGLENRPYMVVDDGWQPNRCDGPWHRGNGRFPDMKGLADAIKEKDVIPGIWIRYLNDEARQTPDVTDDMRLERDPAFLDPTHPAVRELIARDTRRLTEEWGYRLIKHDFSTCDLFGRWGFEARGFLTDDGWRFYDRSRTSAEIVTDLYRAIRENAGDAVVLGCNVIGHLTAGLAEMNRTGDDTSGREWERTRKMGVNTLAFRMLHHGAFYDADADCVGVTGLIPWERNREWLRALAVSGTPLFVSCDPKAADDEIRADITTAFARSAAQDDELVPLDWMDNTCPERWLLNGEEIRFRWIE